MKEEDYKTVYEIPVEEAKKWILAWIDCHAKGSVKGFLIDADELRCIIDEAGAKYMRIYFAINEDLPEDNHKLVMVPVDEEGYDMVARKTNADDDGSNVFDFTMPCPPTCDATSALQT